MKLLIIANVIAWLAGLGIMWWYFQRSKIETFACLVPDAPSGSFSDWCACFIWTVGLLMALIVIGPCLLISRLWRGR